jgi:hypothetical protein
VLCHQQTLVAVEVGVIFASLFTKVIKLTNDKLLEGGVVNQPASFLVFKSFFLGKISVFVYRVLMFL